MQEPSPPSPLSTPAADDDDAATIVPDSPLESMELISVADIAPPSTDADQAHVSSVEGAALPIGHLPAQKQNSAASVVNEAPPPIPEAQERRATGKRKPHTSHHRTAVLGSLKHDFQIPPQSPRQQRDNPVYLCLAPLNDTFIYKTIKVPFFPDTLLLGRQTNPRTTPTRDNGFFDSRVLSRQHAQIWADPTSGQVWIRDIKSANGTFINGHRLSGENEESEPYELKTDDTLDLGIDISSEESKTVLHNRVSAKVLKAGFVSSPPHFNANLGDFIGSADSPSSLELLSQFGNNNNRNSMSAFMDASDPHNSNGLFSRSAYSNISNTGLLPNGAGTMAASLKTIGGSGSSSGGSSGGKPRQRIISRMMATNSATALKGPISLEMVIKKINSEVQFAKAQNMDLQRAMQLFESMAQAQAGSAQRAAKVAAGVETAENNSNDKPAELSTREESSSSDKAAKLLEANVAADTSSTAETQQKLLSLTVALKSLEQEAQEANERMRSLESLLERESFAREQAESKLVLAQRELELEREQAISDLCAEDDENDLGPLVAADEAEAEEVVGGGVGGVDTMALIDKEQKRRMRSGSTQSASSVTSNGSSSSSGSDGKAMTIGQALAQLEQTRRDQQHWEIRALKAEHVADENARALENLVQQIQGEKGIQFVPSSPGTSPTRGGGRFGRMSTSATTSSSSSPQQGMPRISTLTPEQFKKARKMSSEAAGGDADEKIPRLAYTPSNGKSLSQLQKLQQHKGESKGNVTVRVVVPLVSSVVVVVVGMGMMSVLNGLA